MIEQRTNNLHMQCKVLEKVLCTSNQTIWRYRFKVTDTDTDILPENLSNTDIDTFIEKVTRFFPDTDTGIM